MKRWIWTAALMMALATTAAHATPAFPEETAQIVAHAGDHRLLILGELHGTRETPRLVQALIESYAARNAPVQLALELPATENETLATYMASNGDVAARRAVRDTSYWRVRDHLHDGRRSQDMLDLIEAARVLRAQGRDVQVFGFDRLPPSKDSEPGQRDAAMADMMRERYAALPANGRLLVLTGNVHGSREQHGSLTYLPMTAQLQDLNPYNVRIEARGGEFWGCRGYRRCGSLPLISYDRVSPRAYTRPDRDYDLWIWLPRFTVARLLDGNDA